MELNEEFVDGGILADWGEDGQDSSRCNCRSSVTEILPRRSLRSAEVRG